MSEAGTVKSYKSGKTATVKSVTLKSAKSDHSGTLKSQKSEKLLGVTDIEPEDEKCAIAKKIPVRRKKPKPRKCGAVSPWDCQNDSLWRIYMKTLADDASKRIEAEREEICMFPDKKRKAFDVPALSDGCPLPVPFRYELNALNQGRRIIDVLGTTTTSVWDAIRDPRSCIETRSVVSSEFEWPKLYPCTTRDVVRERKILARKLKMKMMGATPCEIDEINSPESSDDERQQELAHQKELIHARIPFTYPKKRDVELVDRAVGEHPGLVDGDYVIFQFASKCGERTIANVCLRGLTGMHVAELARARDKTWKFCMFQALVALLAKTQLRYKFVWSANVDYIYQHAWMIFLHVGYLDVKPNQRFDDVLVYNYKYDVELELVHELKNVRVVQDVDFHYYERAMKKHKQLPRKELTLAKNGFSTEKFKDEYGSFVHRETRKIEKWFDNLDLIYSNCIFRTSRFALAFWQDGSFWYLYNPYRCDKFGFWKDDGYACFVKFCSRDSLKRHLVVLTLRAYAYEAEVNRQYRSESAIVGSYTTKSFASSMGKRKRFTLQIYQLIYHSCRIHNVKLLLREPWKPKPTLVEKKKSDPCTFDPLDALTPKPCEDLDDDQVEDNLNVEMEQVRWLKAEIVWAKYPAAKTAGCCQTADDPPKWNYFEVIESKRLYILWGNAHITQKTFAEENRGKQAATCYAVCAGMCLMDTPEFWNDEVLDAIVKCGDEFYTERYGKSKEPCEFKNTRASLPIDDWDERPSDQFRIGQVKFDLLAKPIIHGRLFVRNNQCLWKTLQQFFKNHTFGLLNCEGAQLAVFKNFGYYYMMDVASYGPPIFEKGKGMVYLLRATCFIDLMKNLVLVIGTPECCKFTLRPIEIVNIVDLGGVDECGRVKVEKCEKKKPEPLFKAMCPKDEDKKKAKKKTSKFSRGGKTFDQTICTEKEPENLCCGKFK